MLPFFSRIINRSSDRLSDTEQRLSEVLKKIAYPFSITIVVNLLFFISDQNWIGAISAASITFWAFLPILLLNYGHFLWALRIFLPSYFFILLFIGFLVGDVANIHFGFFLIVMAASIIYKDKKNRLISGLAAYMGYLFCFLLYSYTTPILHYPYPQLGKTINGLAIGYIALQIFFYYRDDSEKNAKIIDKSRKRYKSLFQGAMDAIFIVNEAGMVISSNKEAKKLFAFSIHEAQTLHWVDMLIMEEQRAAFKELLRSAIEHEQAIKNYTKRFELRLYNQFKTPFEAELAIVPLKQSEQCIFTCFVRDISDQKAARLALKAKNQELERFASIASHDMKEPLRTISAFTSLLEKQIPPSPKTDEFLMFIKSASKRLTLFLDDLITYARAGISHQESQIISLMQVMRIVEKSLFQLIKLKKAQIIYESLPDIEGHKTLIVQLFQNLISNGIKFHQPNVPPIIRVSATKNPTYWEIVIQDNGIGISEEYQKIIFEPFSRLHGIAQYEGSGIGLATCMKIVKEYNGNISVKSVPNQGTSFKILLPIGQAVTKNEATENLDKTSWTIS